MSRRRAKRQSRNAPLPREHKGCRHEFKGKTPRCVYCGVPDPYRELSPSQQHLVDTARMFEVRHIPERDERPPEYETFSGGVNLSARRRNVERLNYVVFPGERLILVGKYTLALLRRFGVVKRTGEANERFEIRERMQRLGLSTEGLRSC